MGDTLVYWGYNLAWKIIRWIPESKAYRLTDRFSDFIYARNGKGVNRLRSNYQRVRPELDSAQLEFLVNAGIRSSMRYWCDTFRFPSWSKERLLSTTVCENESFLRDPIAEKRGCIVALPHAGNWDHAGAYFCATGIPLTTVAEHLKPEKLFRKFLEYRTAIGMEVLDLDSRSIALLAIQTGADLITAFVKYEDVGIRIIFEEAIAVPESGSVPEKAAVMTQVMADRFAKHLAVNTVDWHMMQRIWLDPSESKSNA